MNPIANAQKMRVCNCIAPAQRLPLAAACWIAIMSKVITPVTEACCRAIAIIAISMKIDAVNV